MTIEVFIENEGGANKKNIFDEVTLEYKKTVEVSRKYPYPYGFILKTLGGDGDNLDCFLLTNREIKSGEVVTCQPIGLMEQIEKTINGAGEEVEEEDHNILAVIYDESFELTESVKQELIEFIEHVFDHLPHKIARVGDFLDEQSAIEYIEKSRNKFSSSDNSV